MAIIMIKKNEPNLDIVKRDIDAALLEDVGSGDISAALLPNTPCTAKIIARESGVLAGQAWADMAFSTVDPSTEAHWKVKEGGQFKANQTLCTIIGKANTLVTSERAALNFLQLLSATASKVHRYNALTGDSKTRLLDTRKTIPGLRYAQKYAVVCGGGVNHRIGLYDAFLIKENHIAHAGSITQVIKNARDYAADRFVEIEVETLEQCKEALDAKPDRIMLDNFTIEDTLTAMNMRKDMNSESIEFEASGGITDANLAEIAATQVDFISLGTLTKDIKAIDLSMRMITE